VIRLLSVAELGGSEKLIKFFTDFDGDYLQVRRSQADRQADERVAEKVFGAQTDAGCGR
jgi:hypothetical protein